MEYSFDVCFASGDVWLSQDENACALVLFTDSKKSTLSSIIWQIKLAFSVIGLSRVPMIMAREKKIKERQPKVPFAYLWFFGTKKDVQGTGVGGKLLDSLIEYYSLDNRSMYLETSSDKNVKWYTNHGFVVYDTVELSYSLFFLRNPARKQLH